MHVSAFVILSGIFGHGRLKREITFLKAQGGDIHLLTTMGSIFNSKCSDLYLFVISFGGYCLSPNIYFNNDGTVAL